MVGKRGKARVGSAAFLYNSLQDTSNEPFHRNPETGMGTANLRQSGCDAPQEQEKISPSPCNPRE
jgi:hypothetical protein